MKIAFINIYQNKVFRGAETFIAELSKRLANNYEVDILMSADLKRIWNEKYDVVIPTNGRLQSFLIRMITWLYGGKVIISGQSGAGLDDRLNLYSFPNYFIALTDYQLKWAERINPFVKITKIPNGVDLRFFTFKGLTLQDRRTILSVGAFTNEKRHDLTIKAVARLNDKNINLIIAGGGGDRKLDIKTLGERLLGKRFKVLSISHDKMPEIYEKASILVFPSVPWESFGIVMLEAMACGIPVVATDDPIRREVVGDAGVLVDPTDINSYAKAIKKALEINWGEKPRNQAKKFDWDIIASSYENLLRNLR